MSYMVDRGYLRNIETGEMQHREVMKRLLTWLEKEIPHKQWETHHKDGNRKNNERYNLIVMSKNTHMKLHGYTKNSFESKAAVSKNNHRGNFLGTSFSRDRNPERKCWQSQIHYSGKRKHLGYFEDPISAEKIYKFVRKELYGVI